MLPSPQSNTDSAGDTAEPNTSMNAGGRNVGAVKIEPTEKSSSTTANDTMPGSNATRTTTPSQTSANNIFSYIRGRRAPSSSSPLLSVTTVVSLLKSYKFVACAVLVLAAISIAVASSGNQSSGGGSTYSGNSSSTGSSSSGANRWSYNSYGTSAPSTPKPTRSPTHPPTHLPTFAPTTHAPTKSPTRRPTHYPTMAPTQYIKAITSEWDVRAAAQKEYLHQHEGQVALAVAGMVFLLLGLAIATLTHGHMCYSGMETVTERDEELLYQRYGRRRGLFPHHHHHVDDSSVSSSSDHSPVRSSRPVVQQSRFFGSRPTPDESKGISDLEDGLLGLTSKRSYSGRAECNTLPAA